MYYILKKRPDTDYTFFDSVSATESLSDAYKIQTKANEDGKITFLCENESKAQRLLMRDGVAWDKLTKMIARAREYYWACEYARQDKIKRDKEYKRQIKSKGKSK